MFWRKDDILEVPRRPAADLLRPPSPGERAEPRAPQTRIAGEAAPGPGWPHPILRLAAGYAGLALVLAVAGRIGSLWAGPVMSWMGLCLLFWGLTNAVIDELLEAAIAKSRALSRLLVAVHPSLLNPSRRRLQFRIIGAICFLLAYRAL